MARGDSMPAAARRDLKLAVEQSELPSPAWRGKGLKARCGGGLVTGFLFFTILVVKLAQGVSLLLHPLFPRAVRAWHRRCRALWWRCCLFASERCRGVSPIFSGDEIPNEENAILVANHQQMPDLIALTMLACRKGRLGDLRWFVNDSLESIPRIAGAKRFRDGIFRERESETDLEKNATTLAKLKIHQVPIWLVTFCEGSRLTRDKLDEARELAREQGWNIPSHTLMPRTKSFVASVLGLRNHIDAVYDVTIGYEDGLPTLWQFFCGWVPRVHLNVKRFPVAALPRDPDSLAIWLRLRFEAKDLALQRFVERGTF